MGWCSDFVGTTFILDCVSKIVFHDRAGTTVVGVIAVVWSW
jgi:hypothetical protein